MNYRGIDFTVVQTSSPTGWKWTVPCESGRDKTGICQSRMVATRMAEYAIDKMLSKSKRKRQRQARSAS
jgi:hypothetical protein